jgi:hypothetical protein
VNGQTAGHRAIRADTVISDLNVTARNLVFNRAEMAEGG